MVAIGVDLGAHGAITYDSQLRTSQHQVLESRERVVFDVLTRVGDPTPMIFWDDSGSIQQIHAEQLFAGEIMRALMAHGHDPARGDGRGIAVAVPGWWTHQAATLAADTLRATFGERITTIDAAEAAVLALHDDGLAEAGTVAMLDVGARTTSATVVTGSGTLRPRVAGRTIVQIDGSGDDLDNRLLHHVLAMVREHDPDSPDPTPEVARTLRDQCREAKHALSTDSSTTFVTSVTGSDLPIRLVRDELDEIAAPWARAAAALLAEAIETSQQPVGSVVVVGGGAHLPLIAQTISAELGLDVVVSDAPSILVARGAQASVAGVDHAEHVRSRRWWRPLSRRGARRRTKPRRRGATRAA